MKGNKRVVKAKGKKQEMLVSEKLHVFVGVAHKITLGTNAFFTE